MIKQNMQSQYTLLASASRSANMDRIIRTFLERRPDGVIVQLGCGLETTYHRCDNGKTHWYAVDLPHVIEYRRGLLPEPERELYISGDAFAKDWIKKVRNDVLDAPILVTAGGLFHYFEEHKVIALLRMIGQFGNMEVVFDTVNKRGIIRSILADREAEAKRVYWLCIFCLIKSEGSFFFNSNAFLSYKICG